MTQQSFPESIDITALSLVIGMQRWIVMVPILKSNYVHLGKSDNIAPDKSYRSQGIVSLETFLPTSLLVTPTPNCKANSHTFEYVCTHALSSQPDSEHLENSLVYFWNSDKVQNPHVYRISFEKFLTV